jgi:dynein heavy chain 1
VSLLRPRPFSAFSKARRLTPLCCRRPVTRKRAEKFIQIKITPAHAKLQERLAYLRRFRKQHEQLKVMTGPTKGLMTAAGAGAARALTNGEAATATTAAARKPAIDMEDEVRLAYEAVRGVDVLDVSVGGTELWVTAEAAYEERVARVENHIIARLRDRLGTARNANEMFRVFSRFNSLLVRQKVRMPLGLARVGSRTLTAPSLLPVRSAARSRSTRRS